MTRYQRGCSHRGRTRPSGRALKASILVVMLALTLVQTIRVQAQDKVLCIWQGDFNNGLWDRYSLCKYKPGEDIILMRTQISAQMTAREQSSRATLVNTTGLNGCPQSQISIYSWIRDNQGQNAISSYTWTRRGRLSDDSYTEGIVSYDYDASPIKYRFFATGRVFNSTVNGQEVRLWVGVSEDDIRANRFLNTDYPDNDKDLYIHPSVADKIRLQAVGLVGMPLRDLSPHREATISGHNVGVQFTYKGITRRYVVESIEQQTGPFVSMMDVTLRAEKGHHPFTIALSKLLARGVPTTIAAWQDGKPLVLSGRRVGDSVLVPLRSCADWLSAEVALDRNTHRISVKTPDNAVDMALGSTEARLGDTPVTLLVAPTEAEGITYVPLRLIVEAFHLEATWDKSNRLMSITNLETGEQLSVDVK